MPNQSNAVTVTPEELAQDRVALARSVRAPHTLVGYRSDWKLFQAWCALSNRSPLPADLDTVCLYVTYLLRRGLRITTATRHVSSIFHFHREAAIEPPDYRQIHELLDSAQRLKCEQPHQKLALTVDQLRAIVATLPTTPHGLRDRAVLLFGFATALRRSNIVEMEMRDLKLTPQGAVVHIRREKQDRSGRGRDLGVPYGKHADTCPVGALTRWLEARGLQAGYVFPAFWEDCMLPRRMDPSRIAIIVKNGIKAIGADPREYGGHSLRAGFVTEAVAGGASEFQVMAQTGHRTLISLRRYFRERDIFRANACAAVGL